MTLLWRHNGRDGVSNHQPQDYLLNRLFRRRSKKTSKLTGLCVGNSPVTGEFPAQMASNAENVSIWWRHDGFVLLTACVFLYKLLIVPYGIAILAISLTSHASFSFVPGLNSHYGYSGDKIIYGYDFQLPYTRCFVDPVVARWLLFDNVEAQLVNRLPVEWLNCFEMFITLAWSNATLKRYSF